MSAGFLRMMVTIGQMAAASPNTTATSGGVNSASPVSRG